MIIFLHQSSQRSKIIFKELQTVLHSVTAQVCKWSEQHKWCLNQSIEEDKDSHFYINRPDAVQSDAMLELETWKPESPTLLVF